MDPDTATASGIELGTLSHATRRPSRSDAARPFGMMGMTPAIEEEQSAKPRLSSDKPPASIILTPEGAVPEHPFEEDDVPPVPRLELDGVNLPDRGMDTTAEIGPSVPPTPGPDTPLDAPWRQSRELERGSPEFFPPTAEDTEREIPNLPPIDGGRDALLFLLGATLTEGVVWGLPYSIGVLHEYWMSSMFPGQNETTLTIASTLPTAMLQFLGMPLGPLIAAMPWHERKIQFAGLAVSSLALVASAFVTQPWQLVLTMGILYPASGAVYLPYAANIFQWFNKYIGLAGGCMICGTGVGGTIYPFVVTALLKKFGYKATMISLGISFAILLAPLIFLNKRRLPVSRGQEAGGRHAQAPVNWGWLKHYSPWVAFACILITALGINIPLVWVPSFAVVINATSPNGTGLVALMNAISVPGNLLLGHLSDRFPVRIVMAVYSTIAAVVTILFWGMFGTSQGSLLAFAVLWSLTAGCQPAMWPTMVNVFSRGDKNVPQVAFGTLMSLRSIGTLTSGPLSTALLKVPMFKGTMGAFGHTNYGALIIFVAVMQFCGTLTMVFFPTA